MAWDFHTLFRQHSGGIARSLRQRGHDADVAADLTQDAFLRALTAAPAQEPGTGVFAAAYLYRIARNLGINHARRHQLLPLQPLDTAADALIAPEPSPEVLLGQREQLRLVAAALLAMPERQRRAYLLHRIEGLPIARIADQTGLSTTRTWELIRDAYRRIVLSCGDI